MILYVTYNDQPSGVYWSQVTDVVDHLNTLDGGEVRLVALVSLRGYWACAKAIRRHSPDAIVIPMVPGVRNWGANRFWLFVLCLFLRPDGMIGRGVFATALGLRLRERGWLRRVCFDARAAYGAEWREYRVVNDDHLIAEVATLEVEVLRLADIRLAVSEALVAHWHDELGYSGIRHVVIPCTLGKLPDVSSTPTTAEVRNQLGWGRDDTVLVYSGTAAGWQSLDLLRTIIGPWLLADGRRRLLILTEDHPTIGELARSFPGQMARLWLPQEDVVPYMEACDIGLLLRHPTATNRVASPTKFAEYLSAGLMVLISRNVGDFDSLVLTQRVGWVWEGGALPHLARPSAEDRARSHRVAKERFSKTAYDPEFGRLVRSVGPSRYRSNEVKSGGMADPNTLVSIVVPSYNKATYLREMVASVMAQTHEAWELLFIDDGSTDDTRTVITALAASDERIKLHFQPTNRGANRCRNLGTELAVGHYVMFLDADDVLGPGCIKGRLDADGTSRFDLVVSTMEVFHTKLGDRSHRWVPSAKDPLAEFLRHELPWSVMQSLWKRTYLLALGGFDERFTRHQDVELHTRALLDPGMRYLTITAEPDCFYRIDEERKVLKPFALLDGFTDSSLRYYFKFREQAKAIGLHRHLLGIIYRTDIQIIHNRRLRLIGPDEHDQLRKKLLTPRILADMGFSKRMLLRLAELSNSLPFRVPGVNFVMYRLMTW